MNKKRKLIFAESVLLIIALFGMTNKIDGGHITGILSTLITTFMAVNAYEHKTDSVRS